MPQPLPSDARDYVLLHGDNSSSLYTTRATPDEIPRANLNLQRAGQRSRYVAARHLGHQPRQKGGRLSLRAASPGLE